MTMRTGDVIQKRYELEAHIGSGGFGDVFRARDKQSGHYVAIKELQPHWIGVRRVVKRFRNEYRVLKTLKHKSIIQVIELLELEDSYAIVMPWLSGGSLEERIGIQSRLSWLPIDVAISITRKLLSALEVVEKVNVVHRDIKPPNVLFGDDTYDYPVLTDFGLAHLPDFLLTSSRPTTNPAGIGTLHYMSPEQLNGQELDIRSDLHSLGTTLFKMLTGRLYFDEQRLDFLEICRTICGPSRQVPSGYRSEIPAWLDNYVLRLIAYVKSDRPASAHEASKLLCSYVKW